MDKEIIQKYLNKKIILNLKTNYTYKGTIINVYNDSLEFKDILGNELYVTFDTIALIQIDRSAK